MLALHGEFYIYFSTSKFLRSCYVFYHKKSMCSYGTHTSKCYPQPDLGYIFKQYVHSRIHIQSTKCPSVTDTFIM